MSYTDDEEIKISNMSEEDDLDLDADLEVPLDDDLVATDDDTDDLLSDEFADLDGSSY